MSKGDSLPYVVCAFFTESYRDEIDRLEVSLRAFDIPYRFRRYSPLESWEATTGIKPGFILDCLDEHPGKDVLYVDADAFIRRPLGDFGQFEGDLGLHFNLNLVQPGRLRTGTIYARPTSATRDFLSEWSAIQSRRPELNDTEGFKEACALPAARDVRFFCLPIEYVKVFDRDRISAYIEHFQASRHLPLQDYKVRKSERLKRRRWIRSALAMAGLALLALAFVLGRMTAGA
ncbi:MAG: hypothetical protein CL908_07125 [Deltaproteobacteria bacterium]|nr:hypothetical protein [Deltaproteobacteria bacterium]